MGEIIQNIHTFVLPQNHTYTLQMNFAYDSWNRPSAPLRNRVLNITYPDSEVVHYQYDAAGQLQSMYGIKDQQTVPIIDFIGYDAMGSRSRIEYGNGTSTYDGYRQRLSQLQTQNGSAAFMDLHYSYDKENNITGIENIAAAVNGLGGVYENEYTYDDMYRLTGANGSFTDNNNTDFPFTLEMSYTASGNIATKNVTADILAADNTVSQLAYEGNYAYNQGQTHTISTISGTGIDMSFQWDLNGNMKVHSDNLNSLNRYLCWDEENRLMAVKDNNYLSAYVYDAAGERVWKLTGEVTQMKISGVGTIDVANLSNKTLYVSPYVVYNQQGYSKHYYAGAERVSSRIGGGTMYGLQDPITDTVTPIIDEYSELSTHLWEMLERSFSACLDLYTDYIGYEPHLESVQESASQNNVENNWYIYHSDHLGSSSFLTDANGDPTQHLQYLPFGENYIEQRVTTDYYTPYTFSAKERDLETGYSYFGARYYDPNVSVWLSVDPMAGKGPGISPYSYSFNKPLNYIDPNGEWPWPPKDIRSAGFITRIIWNTRLWIKEKVLKSTDPIIVRTQGGPMKLFNPVRKTNRCSNCKPDPHDFANFGKKGNNDINTYDSQSSNGSSDFIMSVGKTDSEYPFTGLARDGNGLPIAIPILQKFSDGSVEFRAEFRNKFGLSSSDKPSLNKNGDITIRGSNKVVYKKPLGLLLGDIIDDQGSQISVIRNTGATQIDVTQQVLSTLPY